MIMMVRLFSHILVGILLLLIHPIAPVHSQEPSHPRLKVGLALSGGGARGIAHIGVLEALEELQVPIDYIAGTSMGSIVGGLYASGMSIQELRKAVEDMNWEHVLQLKANRDQLSYREKQNQRRYFNFEFGLNAHGQLNAPSGFIASQELFLELKKLTKNLTIDDFGKLPIPFKAVATDLANPKAPYLLEKGELALAMRASMAIPFAFSPITIEGHLLVDGGIVNNIPVDIVRNMGADIVIAVDIATPVSSQIDSGSSLLTVAKQSLDIALIQNAIRILKEADIIVEPVLGDLTITDFDKSADMIQRGREAIFSRQAAFSPLRMNIQDYRRYRHQQQQRQPISPQTTLTPRFIEIVGEQRTSRSTILHQVENLKNRTLVFPEEVEEAVYRIMTLKEFEHVNYSLTHDLKGQKGLLFQVREKSWGPHYFQLGLNASTSFDNKIEFTLLGRYERLNLNSLGGEWINELEVGTGYLLRTEFYQPLDYNRRFFIAPFAGFERAFPEIFREGKGIAEYDVQSLRVGLELGMNFSNVAELRVGLQRNEVDANLRIGDQEVLPTGKTQENLLTFKWGYDNLDDRIFATQGLKLSLEGNVYKRGIGSDLNYQQILLYGRQYYPVHAQITLLGEMTLATAFNSSPPEYQRFSIGGFDSLAGYPEGEMRGKHALVIRGGSLFQSPYLPFSKTIATRLATLFHVGEAWDYYADFKLPDLHYGGSMSLIWDTRFGTLLMGLGYTEGGSLRYQLSLGSVF